MHVKFPTSTKFAAVQADRGHSHICHIVPSFDALLLSFLFTDLFRLWFCSTSYAEIPVAVVESKTESVIFATWRHFML